MTYDETLDFLTAQSAVRAPRHLRRMLVMADVLCRPQNGLAVVQVAGSNGKGSAAVMIAAGLRAAGYRVGLYTSPHLHSYRERIRLDGQLISEGDFAAGLTMLRQQAMPAVAAAGLGQPTVFELLTMLAFWYYPRQGADVAVLECGLGGGQDAVNIAEPVLSVLTPVSLEHCGVLGNTLTAIAEEKAGIIKKGVPAVTAPQPLEVQAVLARRAAALGSRLIVVQDKQRLVRQDDAGQVFELEKVAGDTLRLTMPLLGAYQRDNAAVAVTALEALRELGYDGINAEAIAGGLAKVSWPGRMETLTLGQGRTVLLDGAHNAAGVAALAAALAPLTAQRHLTLLLGILDDKDKSGMLRRLLPLADRVIVTRPPAEIRAREWAGAAALAAQLSPELPVEAIGDYQAALAAAVAALPPGGLLCITGSLYLLADCRQWLLERAGNQ